MPFDEKIMSDLFRKIQAAEVQYPAWFSEDVRDLLGKVRPKREANATRMGIRLLRV